MKKKLEQVHEEIYEWFQMEIELKKVDGSGLGGVS